MDGERAAILSWVGIREGLRGLGSDIHPEDPMDSLAVMGNRFSALGTRYDSFIFPNKLTTPSPPQMLSSHLQLVILLG